MYDLAPPAAITQWLASHIDTGLRPLAVAELAAVRITSDQARANAMGVHGFGYGPGSSIITWTKTGCLYLGYYRGSHEPSVGYVPPEYPAYIVQVIGARAEGFPNLNVAITVVDAQTGKVGPTFGSGDGPVLGATCGATS